VCADRLSRRGGADQHLLEVIAALSASPVWAVGRVEGVAVPGRVVRLRGLGAGVADERLQGLDALIEAADLIWVQNVMNPVALRRLTATGRAVVVVQDHRVFCPGPGRTLPDATACQRPFGLTNCEMCLPDRGYRERLVSLTGARLDALRAAARVVVLSHYMQDELSAAGVASEVVPPWVEAVDEPVAGDGFVVGGRLVAHKAPEVASEACRLAGAHLSVAGAGRLASALRGEALGWLEAAALRKALKGARALLFPGRWQEPFGILGVEALAVGTPVIVGASGGVNDWADAGCLRVAPGDVAGMSAAVASLQADPRRARALGAEGQAMVRQRFARGPLVARLRRLAEDVADGRSRRAAR